MDSRSRSRGLNTRPFHSGVRLHLWSVSRINTPNGIICNGQSVLMLCGWEVGSMPKVRYHSFRLRTIYIEVLGANNTCSTPTNSLYFNLLFTILPARRYASAGVSRSHLLVCPSVCLSVRPSVCLSHADIVSKRLNVGSRKQHRMIAQGL